MIDTSANRALLSKFYNEAYDINNNYQWPSTKQATVKRAKKIHNADVLRALSA